MILGSPIDHWGSTAEERAQAYAGDRVLPGAEQVLFRAVTVAAPPSIVYRWLCQLKLAPYSYDLIDNLGRRSPQHLVPGVEDLAIGQKVAIFDIVSFAVDDHLTIATWGHRAFGDVAITYAVRPDGTGGTRLVVKLATNPIGGSAGAILRRLLPVGDLVMMHRQLGNLQRLAERTAAEARSRSELADSGDPSRSEG